MNTNVRLIGYWQETGGPLPAGKYSRRMVAITEEGEEWNFGPGLLEEVEIAGP